MTAETRRLGQRLEYPFVALLGALMTILAAHPFLAGEIWERIVFDLLLSAVLLTGLWSAASHLRQFRIGLVLAIPAILSQWVVYAT